MLISHDRRFLERLSRATVWLDRGVTRRIERGFASFEEWRDQVLEEEEKEQHKLGRKIVAEEHWMRYGVSGRRKRNVRRVGLLQELRKDFREHRGALGSVKIAVNDAELSGKLVAEAKGISKSFGDTPIVRDFSIRIQRGDRIGLVGPNGAGKTTLLNMLIGELAPDEGVVKLGANIQMATLDQRRDTLDPNTSVRDTLTGGRGDRCSSATRRATSSATCGTSCSRRSRPAPRYRGCPAASAAASRWRWRSPSPRTCWCSTSRPTISTSKRSICWKR